MHKKLLFFGEQNVLVLLYKATKLLFVPTKLFRTIGAGKTSVCGFGKTFRMRTHSYFPYQNQYHRYSKKAYGKKVTNKHQGSKHHSVIPIIYTAGYAATIFHKPCLKRTEEQYAYHIAHAVCKAYQKEYPAIENIQEIRISIPASITPIK